MTRKEFWQAAYLTASTNSTLESAIDRCDFAEKVANIAVLDWDNFSQQHSNLDKVS